MNNIATNMGIVFYASERIYQIGKNNLSKRRVAAVFPYTPANPYPITIRGNHNNKQNNNIYNYEDKK